MKLLIGMVLAALSVAAFASTFVFGGDLTRHCGVSPMAIVIIRYVFAGLLMLAWGARNREGRRRYFTALSARDWLLLAIVGPIGTSLMAWCVFAACESIGSASAAMSDALAPLMIFVWAAIASRRVTYLQCVGAIAGFIGCLMVIGVVSGTGVRFSAYGKGDLLVFFAALTWAIYTVAARDFIARHSAAVYTVWTMLFGVVICLPLPFCTEIVWPTGYRAWLDIAYICLVPTIIAYWAWNEAQRYLRMSTLAMMAYFTPVVAALIGVGFFGESITTWQWLGTLLISIAALVEVKK